MNGLEMTLAPFKIWLCHGRERVVVLLEHLF